MHHVVLLFHLLGASIWTGGHLLLALVILPQVLRSRDLPRLQQFEAAFERVGIPALLIQVATGLLLAWQRLPVFSMWLDWNNPAARPILCKLALLLLTLLLALDARLRLIPRLTPERLPALAWHIIPVTLISVLFVVTGVAFQAGWLY